jgi:membrane protease YdiL (CAAX protease family)
MSTQLPDAVAVASMSPPDTPPALRARRVLWILAMYVVTQVVAGVLAGLVVGIYVSTRDVVPDARTAGVLGAVPAAMAGAILGGLLALWMSKRSFRGSSAQEFYETTGWAPASRRQILVAALVGAALAASYLLVAYSFFPPQPYHSWHPLSAAVASSRWSRHAFAVLALLLAPPVEEFLFRGVLFAGLARSWPLPTAACVTTMLFVLLHVSSVHPYWPGLFAIASVATVALRARIVTKSLAPCIAVHTAYNLGLVVAVYAGAAS